MIGRVRIRVLEKLVFRKLWVRSKWVVPYAI